jgi:hypothetical protein
MARLITPDGAVAEVKPKRGPKFTLGEVQNFLDGNFGMLYLQGGEIMLFDDLGKFKDKRRNTAAARYVAEHGGLLGEEDWIAGTALVVGGGEVS